MHLWSLGIEEQFYIFWPIFLLFFKHNKFLKTLLFLFLISLFSCIFLSKNNAILAFYLPVTRGWELIIGSLLAYIYVKNKYKLKLEWNNFLSTLGLFLLLGFFFFYDENYQNLSNPWPNIYTLLPCVGTALIIYAGQDTFINRNILSNQIIRFIGLISYPLYLWHWLI